MLRSITAAVLIGVLGGFWFALVNGSIELFQNYVEGVWRYQFAVRSFAAPLVGLVIGVLVGANIRLALAHERAGGFTHGTLVGAAVGAVLVLAQVALTILAANFGDFRANYQSLLTRFSGIVFTAAVSGAAVGMLTRGRPPVAILSRAVVGAMVGVSFVLPVIVTVVHIIASEPAVRFAMHSVLPYFIAFGISPIVGAAVAAVVSAVTDRLTTIDSHSNLASTAVVLGVVVGVTVSSPSFSFVTGWQTPPAAPVGIFIGAAVGLAIVLIASRVISARGNDAGMISPE